MQVFAARVSAAQAFDPMADATCGAIACATVSLWNLCRRAERLSPMEWLNL
jgi:hypothetical protein